MNGGPAEIIHVGDAPAEIVGAKKAGLTACWLNRTSQLWPHSAKPDYEVQSLKEAAHILGVEAGYESIS